MKTLKSVNLTNNQLRVLAIIAANKSNPKTAAKQISTGYNIIAARNILLDLEAITYSSTKATMTDKGEQLAQDNDIIDDAGEITDTGNQLLSKDDINSTDNTSADMNSSNVGSTDHHMFDSYSFSGLFKQLLNS